MSSPPVDAAPFSPLTLRVAFSGHRSVDEGKLEPALRQSFALIDEAAARLAAAPVRPHDGETVAAAHNALWPGETANPRLELLVGYAEGADRIACRLWRGGGHGGLHAVFPFADAGNPDAVAWTHGPDATDPRFRVALAAPDGLAEPFDAVTILNGGAALTERPPRDAHLEQTRWVLRWADLAVVAWNGRPAAGTGGTADTVAQALRKELPVLWIDTESEGMPVRMLTAERLWLDGQFSELVDALADPQRRETLAPGVTAEALVDLLLPIFRPPSAPVATEDGAGHPHDDDETAPRRDYAGPDPLSALPEGAGVVRRVRRYWLRLLAAFLARSWAGFYRSLARPAPAGGAATAPGQAVQPHPLIAAAFAQADMRANFYGDLHRALQALLLAAAVLAVGLGTLPAVFPRAKFGLVLGELVVVLSCYRLWKLAFVASNHQRWSDMRRLAERLRALAATWPLGFDVGDDRALPPATWTEWQARAVRRAAGPPTGLMSVPRLRAAARAASQGDVGIVAAQAGYNLRTQARMSRLHHMIHLTEQSALYVLFGVLVGFLVFYLSMPEHVHGERWFVVIGGLVLMTSAVIPTIAAACLAIDAKLGIEENARRAGRLAAQFAALDEAMTASESPADAQEYLRDAAHLLLADIDSWRDAAVRRRIATL
jgi:hypothetical protein